MWEHVPLQLWGDATDIAQIHKWSYFYFGLFFFTCVRAMNFVLFAQCSQSVIASNLEFFSCEAPSFNKKYTISKVKRMFDMYSIPTECVTHMVTLVGAPYYKKESKKQCYK